MTDVLHVGSCGSSLDPNAAPLVSVIIPCRNEVRHIETCLRDVLAFQAVAGGFEVIVADGMSNDGTREIIQRIAAANPQVRMVDNVERTTPCALNAGIRVARGEVVVRIDAHTEYAPDYLRRCLEVFRETDADNVGGPALTRATTYMQRAVAAAYHSRLAVGNSMFHQPGYEGPADTVPYGCYAKTRLMEIGLFDEELVRNQDDELNFRLLLNGGKIWQSPKIRSWYKPRNSLKSLFRQYFQYGYWKVRVMQKHGRPASLRHLVPGSFAAILLLLAATALLTDSARIGFGALTAAYLLAVIPVSTMVAARAGWDLLPILPAVFACYHLGYGFGFLFGFWDFMVCQRMSGRFVALTRQ